MKVYLWQKIAILLLLIFAVAFAAGMVEASNPLPPPAPTPPAQGCTTPSGAKYTTCAFYVVASSISQTSNDAGMRPECNYDLSAPEIYFGRCNLVSTPIVSGFRFQNVSISIPTGQSILASYIEFTVDGTYTNQVVANIYGQRATPTPKAFSGTNASDITNRLTVPPTAQWKVESTAKIYNMGDPWSLGQTRRTPDITAMLTTIKGASWQTSSNVVFLFKSDYQTSTAARRVTAFERAGYKPTRLVARVGQIPRPSVSYYWQSVSCGGTPRVCTPSGSSLQAKAVKEAQRNRPVLVILDFGNPKATDGKMGTTLVSKPNDYVPISKIEPQIKIYINEFMANDSANSKLWLGIGTNNAGDLMCVGDNSSRHGKEWALMINRLQTWLAGKSYNTAANPDKIKISAAIDIETWTGRPDSSTILVCNGQPLPDAIAPASEALKWAQAYSAETNYSYINFGNLDSGTQGLGIDPPRWGADLTWELSWGIPEAYPLPEIYSPTGTISESWQTLARYSAICQGPSTARCQPEIRADDPNWVATKGRAMQFLGALTNFGEQNCDSSDTNSPNQGWLQLYRHLVTDLYTDNNFPVYSSDITFEDYPTHQTADTCPIP